jgi:hypothetical protein
VSRLVPFPTKEGLARRGGCFLNVKDNGCGVQHEKIPPSRQGQGEGKRTGVEVPPRSVTGLAQAAGWDEETSPRAWGDPTGLGRSYRELTRCFEAGCAIHNWTAGTERDRSQHPRRKDLGGCRPTSKFRGRGRGGQGNGRLQRGSTLFSQPLFDVDNPEHDIQHPLYSLTLPQRRLEGRYARRK